MMRKIQRIWEEILQGENIELYVTVATAVALAFLSLVGYVPQQWLTSVNLAILSLLAIAMLTNRHRMENFTQKFTSPISPPMQLRTDLAPLRKMANDAKDIVIVGRTALSALRDTEFFKDKLDQGASIRLAVVNPDDDAVIEAIARAVETDVQGLINDMGLAKSLMRSIREQTPDATRFQVRVFDYVPTLSLVMVDGHLPTSQIIFEMTPYKTNPTLRPHLLVTAKDHPVWHAYFCNICETTWRDASPSSAHFN